MMVRLSGGLVKMLIFMRPYRSPWETQRTKLLGAVREGVDSGINMIKVSLGPWKGNNQLGAVVENYWYWLGAVDLCLPPMPAVGDDASCKPPCSQPLVL